MAAQQQETMSRARAALLADLRQRATWREQSAAEYGRAGNELARDYFTGQADGFRSAAYIVEHYHPEV